MTEKITAKSLATVDDNKNALPAYLAGKEMGSGLQGLDSNDYVVPRVLLLQGTSEQVENFEAANQGDFWLNVLDIPLGKQIRFTPILNRKRVMLIAPRDDGKGVLARADDGKTWRPPEGSWSIKLKGVREPVTWEITDPNVAKSGLLDFGTSQPGNPDSNPAATLFYDFLVLIHDVAEIEGVPVLLSLARSAAKKGRDLNGKIGFGAAPMQARAFIAKPVADNNSAGDKFFNWMFSADGYVPEHVFNRAKAMEEQFTNMNFRGAGDEDDGEGGAGSPSVQSGGAY